MSMHQGHKNIRDAGFEDWAKEATGRLAPLLRKEHGARAREVARNAVGAAFHIAVWRELAQEAERDAEWTGETAKVAEYVEERARLRRSLDRLFEPLDGRSRRRAWKIVNIEVGDQ